MSLEPQSAVVVLPYIVYLVLGALALSILVLVSFVFFSASFFRKIFSSRSELEKRRRAAHQEAEAILEKARIEAREVGSRASAKAAEFLAAAQLFNSSSEKEIGKKMGEFVEVEKERLQKSSEKFVGTYDGLIAEARKSYLSSIQSFTQAMQEEGRKIMFEFQKNLEGEMVRYRSGTDEKLKEWQATARKEIDGYKSEALVRIDEAIYRLIGRVSKEIFGEALDLRHHQKLVLSSLERAKKEGFFHEN